MGKKANAGDPLVIGATDWNNARDAGADYAERRALGERNPPRYSQPIDHVICKVRNDSGADRSRGDVLELGTYLLTDADNHTPWFEGETPDTTRLSFAILQEPIKQDEIGKAFIAGVGYAVVNVSDAAHKFAYVKASAYKLESGTGGNVKILHKPSGTGDKNCMVQIVEPDKFWPGKADSAISKGSTGTVSLWTYNGSAMADTGLNVTALAWGAAITSGKIVTVQLGQNGMWYVGPWEC
jgi:hypothetical protein